jgi:hypothetical protein
VPSYVGAVVERAVHFEAVIVLSPKILDVSQYHAFAIGAMPKAGLVPMSSLFPIRKYL